MHRRALHVSQTFRVRETVFFVTVHFLRYASHSASFVASFQEQRNLRPTLRVAENMKTTEIG